MGTRRLLRQDSVKPKGETRDVHQDPHEDTERGGKVVATFQSRRHRDSCRWHRFNVASRQTNQERRREVVDTL